jgi:hypothetical protein
LRLWAGTIAGIVLLILVLLLVPPPAGWRVEAAEPFVQQVLERRAAAAPGYWHRSAAEPDDESANAENGGPADTYDGLYAGTATTRAAIHPIMLKVKVAGGIGRGTQSRPDCGIAPVALRISPSGTVSGMVLIFGSTCLKTELAIGGRAVNGALLLRLGSQYVELAKVAN